MYLFFWVNELFLLIHFISYILVLITGHVLSAMGRERQACDFVTSLDPLPKVGRTHHHAHEMTTERRGISTECGEDYPAGEDDKSHRSQ